MNKPHATPSHALPQPNLQLKPLVQSILTWAQRPSALAIALGAMPALALAAMPSGGKVVAGAATIANPDGNHTVINQSSDKAVLNWQSFSIGEGGYVQFVQRDANSVALNRVVGSDPSSILGNLSANGQIFLVNQNGIFFGHSAKVDVAGIVATTLDIKDEDFMRGDYRFARGANAPARATVINEGTLNANGGYVVLAGDYVANKGVVQAQLGTVLMASGDALTLQMAGSSLINYQVDKATVAHLAGVENSGQVLANGGRVIMTADVAQDLAATVVNNSGLVQAQSAVEKNGAIYFEGKGGSVANSGTLDASAQAGAHGGHVEIRASGDIAHEAGSKIDVSGAGTGVSDAGSVNTWADGTNRYKEGASIVARGGLEGGNGGAVELSGNHVVNRSIVDLRAPKGELGTLTLDPLAITIADGAGADSGDGATIYEQNLEAQLKAGNVSLLATGQDASITVADLADGVLDGRNNGGGGSLTLRAEGGGNPTVSFANRGNSIKVDKAIAISTGDIEAPASGTIDVGQLEAGTRIDLESGSIRAAGLKVNKTFNSVADTSFAINARARTGSLTVDGDVDLDVTNTAVGALATSVSLIADNGSVSVGGAVNAKATGLGYYNYNWTTAGNAATTYLGQQPWTLVGQADHAISSGLTIQASGAVNAGAVNVLATDRNTAFDTSIGGYWQTANATQHNFWRPTATSAAGTITAAGNVSIAGKTTIKADGYAVSDYTETESWRTMVNNFNYTSANQTVRTQGCLSYVNGNCTGYGYNGSYVYTDTRMKGGATGNYIWEFGEYTSSLPATANDSPNYTRTTDRSTSNGLTGMSYSGARGMSATLNLNAGGSVTMNGTEVRATNHSATGSASFTDGDWGRQDTAYGLNGTATSFTSANRETDYYDSFRTDYTAGLTTASANITAGDNASIALHGGTDVIAELPNMNPANTYQAGATLNVSAGAAGGASGSGLIVIENGVNVIGAKNADVSLNIRNVDGAIKLDGAPAVVTNGYTGADARATVQSDNAAVHLESLAVNAGRSAYLTLGGDSILVDGASRAIVTGPSSVGTARVIMNANKDISAGDVVASSDHVLVTRVSEYYDQGYDYTVDGGSASVDVRSTGGNLDLRGDVIADGYKTATVALNAAGTGATLATGEGKTVRANVAGDTFTTTPYQRYTSVPTYSAGVTMASNGAMEIGSGVEASLDNRNGVATVAINTTGGADATITQAASSVIVADGVRGSTTLTAGQAAPTGAAVDLAGGVTAKGSTGTGTVSVIAASGRVHDFGASSTGNSASVTLTALDAAGTLAVDGNGAISANFNAANGAALNINAAGALDTHGMAANVVNVNTGNAASAGTVLAASGDLHIGTLSMSGFNAATVSASAGGDLSVSGAVSASASAAAGQATVTLAPAGNLALEAGASASATANGSGGNASVALSGKDHVAIDGNVSATALSNGNAIALVSTSAADSRVTQGAASTVRASGSSSGQARITAGSTNNGSYDLQGGLHASATGGLASVAVNGRSGAVHDFSAIAGTGPATANIVANSGALALTGDANVSGYNVGTLNASATGNLSSTGSLATAVTATGATARANLTSSGASLTVAGVSASATGSNGDADLNLTAATGIAANGNLSASAVAGAATIDLVTTGGASAAITQDAASTIAASGRSASVGIAAGAAVPADDIANSAAFDLHGAVRATSTTGNASLNVAGAAGSVKAFEASSLNAQGTASISALQGDLTLDGGGTVSGKTGGAVLHAEANGALDASAAALTVTSTGANGADYAEASLEAYGGSAKLGAATVQANGGAAGLYASSTGAMRLQAGLSAVSLSNTATVDLTTTGGAASTITQDAGTTILASGSDASVGISAGSSKSGARATFALNGAIQTVASNGAAAIGIDGAGGSVHDFSAQATRGSAEASITGVDAGASVVLDGAGSVKANADDAQGAWLNVASAGALDTGAATLAVENASSGESGGARADLDANGGNATLGNTSVSGGRTAVFDATASANLGANGALASTATAVGGTASAALAAEGSATIAALANVSASALNANGVASVDVNGGLGVTVHGGLQANAASQATVNAIATGGDLALDGALGAASARNATVNATAVAGKLTQSAGTILAGGANSGQVNLTSNSAMTVNGNVTAAATADGTANGLHTGSALANLTTTGGASASITQGGASTIEAVGRAAYVTVKAGDANPAQNIAQSAAFDLGGTLRAVDAIGGSSLVVGGASGRVHDVTVTAAQAPASAVITAFNGNLVLDGATNVVANTSSSTGASLRADASGSIDTSAAQISVSNLSGDDGAGARAELYAEGSAKLGNIAVSANAAAQLSAMAGADVNVAGRLSAAGTAAYGQARADLTAVNAVNVAAAGVVNVTGGNANANGSASLNLDGGHGVNVAGSLNAYGNDAGIGLKASGGNIALDGALTAQGQDRAAIDAVAGGSLTQAAGSSLHSGAASGVAQIDLASTAAMTINGQLSAAATADGSVNGAHSGAALIDLATVGGASASLTQGAGSTIQAVGLAARLDVAAGDRSPQENVARGAAFKLDGTLRAIDDIGGSALTIAGALGSVHDFTVSAGDATASARIGAYNGDLVLNGAGKVGSAAGHGDGASLLATASGALDTTAAVLNVSNSGDSRSAGATATLAAGGNAVLGTVNATGGNATIDASAGGKVSVTKALTASATGEAGIKLAGDTGVSVQNTLNTTGNVAYVNVVSSQGGIALGSNVTATGAETALVEMNAMGGTLVQDANTVVKSGATSGVAQVHLASKGAMTVKGNIVAAATADGTTGGAHTGAALVDLTTTGGATASIVQDKASTIEAVGRAARLDIHAGNANPGANVAQAAAFKLDGTLRAIDAFDGASLTVSGASGNVHDFTVLAADGSAHASISAVNGDLAVAGTGTVKGNSNAVDGASLTLSASGSLDTTAMPLSVSNVHSGDEAGAQATLLASKGAAKLGVAKVTAQGGGSAALKATAGATLTVNSKLDAENLGLGAKAGSASIVLNTTGKTDDTSKILQNGGAVITAATKGNAGDATVDIQAGNCCNSAIELNDTVKAVVTGGSGSATIAARANAVAVKDLTANVLAAGANTGTGNTMVSLAAPGEVKLSGIIDSQAASATARAQVQLVTDTLSDGASFKLSKGNGHVQLAPFSTGKIIGVHSDKDFDETADVNYNMLTLKKFMTQGAELVFGGEYDRSAWLDEAGKACVPGMDGWASQLQHTGAIHVAGNGRLNLGDVKMVFDTTGITTYHDPKMSAWSVPTGRVATLVLPPSNVDRYLDRTDNTVQNMNKVVQETTSSTRSSGAPETGMPAARGTQIAGKLFMEGNGVNMVRNEAADGSQAEAQGPDRKSLNIGDSTEQ